MCCTWKNRKQKRRPRAYISKRNSFVHIILHVYSYIAVTPWHDSWSCRDVWRPRIQIIYVIDSKRLPKRVCGRRGLEGGKIIRTKITNGSHWEEYTRRNMFKTIIPVLYLYIIMSNDNKPISYYTYTHTYIYYIIYTYFYYYMCAAMTCMRACALGDVAVVEWNSDGNVSTAIEVGY